MLRRENSITLFNVKHDYFKNSFFPYAVLEWNNLDPNIRTSESLTLFKKHISAFIRHVTNITFQCHNPKGLKLITRLRLGLSHPKAKMLTDTYSQNLNIQHLTELTSTISFCKMIKSMIVSKIMS